MDVWEVLARQVSSLEFHYEYDARSKMAADRSCDIKRNHKIMWLSLLEWSWIESNSVELGVVGQRPPAVATSWINV